MTKVLIANRGEIACRIMQTCKRMGLTTVAVYSEADTRAKHVALADEAHEIGPAPVRKSYLRMDAILDVAQKTGATLVHPGYGLLSENPEFARRVMDAGLKWVGPDPASMDLMADKERARDAAEKCGVPVIKGSGRIENVDATDFESLAEEIGFPLLIKATAGGGGIGMRICKSAESLAKAARSVSEMAARSFGEGTIILERYIERARHIEVQVFGIGDGRILTLFDRDCSAQRRFQKVVEEAPAPRLSQHVRDSMAECARALAGRLSYSGAGTVEFVYDDHTEEFFFLEMNTRLQVEHPVTEMVTGLDLVEMQLRLAMEDGVQELARIEPVCAGHAIECRIYAEDPDKNFFPSPGVIELFETPDTNEHLRIDTGIGAGSEITPFYDPLIAKVIAYGDDRASATDRLVSALQKTRINGLTSNIQFLEQFLNWQDFAQANLSTNMISEFMSTD